MKGCIRKYFSFGILFACVGVLSISQVTTFLGAANAGDTVFGTSFLNIIFNSDFTFKASSDVTVAQTEAANTTLNMFEQTSFDSSLLNVTLSIPLDGVSSNGLALSHQLSVFINTSIMTGLLHTLNVNDTESGLAGDIVTVGVPEIPVPNVATAVSDRLYKS